MKRPGALLLACLAGLAALPAAAQQIVRSAAPDRVAVTLYRDPNRDPGAAFELSWLGGFAMVTETRRIELPAGEAEIRFEGVAGGILPQSAIVTGLPDGVVERNRDAYLLSPGTLLDRSLGRRVLIRRTMHGTGAVTETEAVIRTGAGGAVVLQTPDGNEALRCTGQSETLVYDGVPAGLSARPTLSVRTRGSRPVAATVTLAYLASGFDWQADYVAQLSPDGTYIDLFAWLTLASSDETSFVDADTQAVAGRVNREAAEVHPPEGGPLTLQCWPAATTSDIPLEEFQRMALGRGPALGGGGQEVVVTGSRIPLRGMMDSPVAVTAISADMIAAREALGDLQLYRIPEPVTVAARSQKQVAFLVRNQLPVRFVYRQVFSLRGSRSPRLLMVARNRAGEQLGEPLPAGDITLFGMGPDRRMLVGEASMRDLAVGEDVEIEFGPSSGVSGSLSLFRRRNGHGWFQLSVANDNMQPVIYEAELSLADVRSASQPLDRHNGQPLWRVTVPANGRATLCFRAAAPNGSQGPPQTVTSKTCIPS